MDREILRFIRQSNKLTVREFGAKVSVSYTLISRIEGGDRRLTDRVKRKVMDAFGLTEDKLATINLLINEIKN